MTEDLKLSAGQAEALEASLVGQPYWYKKIEFPERTNPVHWVPKGARGGARYRIADTLQNLGLFSDKIHDKEITAQFGAVCWEKRITAKGLRALDAYLRSGRRYDPTDGRLKMIADQLPIREKLEADIAAAITAKRARDQAAAKERRDRTNAKHLAELRARLSRHGLDDFQLAKTDDELLAFARDIEGAEYV